MNHKGSWFVQKVLRVNNIKYQHLYLLGLTLCSNIPRRSFFLRPLAFQSVLACQLV